MDDRHAYSENHLRLATAAVVVAGTVAILVSLLLEAELIRTLVNGS